MNAQHTPAPLREQITTAIAQRGLLGGKPLPNAPKLTTSAIRSQLSFDWMSGRAIKNPPRAASVLRELRKLERDGIVECVGETRHVFPSWRSRGAPEDGELVWREIRTEAVQS